MTETLSLWTVAQLDQITIDRNELAQSEAIIERSFVEAGNELKKIQDKKLYRHDYSSFDDYCRERWGWERTRAYRLINAANTIDNLLPMGNILPTSERQARPLTSLEPEQQREAWQRAMETAPEGKITAAHVQSVVDEITEKRPHVVNNSGNNEWYTPPEFIDAARRVLGEIDLDPASSEVANQTVGAKIYFTAEDDGLLYSWDGRVWMNPPYASGLIDKFCSKLAAHYLSGEVKEAVVLVNNATETNWFQSLLDCAGAVCFVKSRIKFIDMQGNPNGAPLQGQAILYLGNNIDLFAFEFEKFGKILYDR